MRFWKTRNGQKFKTTAFYFLMKVRFWTIVIVSSFNQRPDIELNLKKGTPQS